MAVNIYGSPAICKIFAKCFTFLISNPAITNHILKIRTLGPKKSSTWTLSNSWKIQGLGSQILHICRAQTFKHNIFYSFYLITSRWVLD